MTDSEYTRLDGNGLRSCPFCGKGKPNIVVDTSNHLWGLTCWNCGCDHSCHDSEEYAIEAWNTRTSDAIIRKQHELIEKMGEVLQAIGNESGPQDLEGKPIYQLGTAGAMCREALTLLREGK